MSNPYSNNAGSPDNFGYGQQDPHAQPSFPAFPGGADESQSYMVTPNPGPGKRLAAFLIDSVLFGVVAGILIAILAYGDMMDYTDRLIAWSDAGQGGPAPELAMGKFYLGAVLSLVLWFAYRVLMEVRYGKTVGKMALGIKVVGTDGQQLTAQQAFLRNSWYLAVAVAGFVPLVGTFLSIGVYAALGVLIARDPQNQHICDKWAQAYVVSAR